MRLWVKIGLFLSSYLPLFLILTIRNWFNLYATILFGIAAIYSLIWALVFFTVKKGTSGKYKVIKVKNKVHESLNYLVPYIISFMGFDLSKWQDWTSLFILLFILFIIYSNSNLLYINPILLLFKYKIYDAIVCSELLDCEKFKYEIFLITKKIINSNDDVALKDIDSDNSVFLGVDDKWKK